MEEITAVDYLAQIEQEEFKSLLVLDKIFNDRSKIYTTAELASKTLAKRKFTPTNEFTPSIIRKIALPVLIIFWSIFFVYGFFDSSSPLFFYIIIPILAVCYFFILKNLFSKKLNYTIHLTTECIKVKNETYRWQDIYEIYITVRPFGRGKICCLFIGLKSGQLICYDMRNIITLWNNEKRLAASIEYFRKKF